MTTVADVAASGGFARSETVDLEVARLCRRGWRWARRERDYLVWTREGDAAVWRAIKCLAFHGFIAVAGRRADDGLVLVSGYDGVAPTRVVFLDEHEPREPGALASAALRAHFAVRPTTSARVAERLRPVLPRGWTLHSSDDRVEVEGESRAAVSALLDVVAALYDGRATSLHLLFRAPIEDGGRRFGYAWRLPTARGVSEVHFDVIERV